MHVSFTSKLQLKVNVSDRMFKRLKNIFSKDQYSVPSLRCVFKPMYIILSILGLFPYSVQLHSSSNGFKIIKKSIYLNLLCAMSNILIIGAFLVLHIRQIYFSIEDNVLTEGIMAQMNYITELFTLTIFCVVTYICVFFYRYRYVKVLNMLSTLIDAPYIDSEKILGRLRFHINIIVMGTLTLFLIVQMAVNYTRNDSVFKMFLVMFTFIVPQMIQFTTIAFFYILIMMVVEIFRSMREHITTPHERNNTGRPTRVESRHGNMTLRQIELIYIEAFAIKQNVNRMFEAPILVTLLQCFHSIVSESHIIYHGVVVQWNLSTHDIANCSIWIVYQVIKIYAITNAGNCFVLEALRLGRTINGLPTEKQDLRFFLEVQHLSALMSFPGKELTIFGYFPLDATLMFKVMASVGMYVIILVQFDKKSE